MTPTSDGSHDWKTRLALIVETMREMSLQTDPQEMVRNYGRRIEQLLPVDRRISLSRRDLDFPRFRVTRDSLWKDAINPWKERDRLPLLAGGMIADLIYGNEPVVIDELQVAADDPAAEMLKGYHSLLAIPMFDHGEAINMVLLLRKEPRAFDHAQVPEAVWRSNLFGRATSNLVLKEERREAFEALERELVAVANIQRSLLPTTLPVIPTLDLAAHYSPARRAGGDYYDFFKLPDGKWGILIADVSGHGTPAAVLMAITHCIVHTHVSSLVRPDELLLHVNRHLSERYTYDNGMFVTAFYAVYDPANRHVLYSNAGHNPPRLKRCGDGTLHSLDRISGLPLGIWEGGDYDATEEQLVPGDEIVFYTDGITEAHNRAGEMFGT
ncbi:MAG: PP2C family protein-serine/threonine phosphatase, partial [Planctomycetota bacterium]|nr:PP2C family protein-serine/threonine phosphatase [Planctomycetota bacterium]